MFSRDSEPEQALMSCLLADGRRAWGTSSDCSVAGAMCDGEWVGAGVSLTTDGTVILT